MTKISNEMSAKHEVSTRKLEELKGEITKLKDSHAFILSERAEDLTQIGDLLKSSTAATIQQLTSKHHSDIERVEVHLEAVRS
jgi:hypothetical protein